MMKKPWLCSENVI